MDAFIKAFEKILKVEKPWHIAKTEVISSTKTVHFYLEYDDGTKFPCAVCGNKCGVYDSTVRVWRHLDICDYRCYLYIKIPRTQCKEHGVKVLGKHEFGRINTHFSFKLEELIINRCRSMSMSAIARELGETDTTLWSVFKHYIKQGIDKMDCSATKRIGVDETASKRGHHYMSVFSDIDTGKVIFVTEGKEAEVFAKFYQGLFDRMGDPNFITLISMDMSKAYIAGQQQYFVGAQVVFDRFHIKKALNEAVDQVRKKEVRTVEELKKTKYIWLKNPGNLTDDQQQKLQTFLQQSSTKTAQAYGLKTAFDQLWAIQESAVEKTLQVWFELVKQSALQPMFRFVRTIKRHYKGVVNSMTSFISNAAAEGLNSIIQLVKSRARGYRNPENFKNMIYFIGNDFKFSFH